MMEDGKFQDRRTVFKDFSYSAKGADRRDSYHASSVSPVASCLFGLPLEFRRGDSFLSFFPPS